MQRLASLVLASLVGASFAAPSIPIPPPKSVKSSGKGVTVSLTDCPHVAAQRNSVARCQVLARAPVADEGRMEAAG